jgi:predicted dehydrogenase
VDLVRWLVGKEVVRVLGSAKRMIMAPEAPDDIGWVLMEFEDGTTCCVSTNRFSPTVSEVTELYGLDGTIYLSSDAINPYQSAPLAVYSGKDYTWEELPDLVRRHRYPQSFFFEDLITQPVQKRWVTISPPREWSYTRMMNHFVDCILSDTEPQVTGEDGAKVMEILCAVLKSMDTNSWVDLPLKEEIVPPGYTPS